MSDAPQVLERLMAVLENRKRNRPPKSYTTTLFAGGAERIGEKIREEAAEFSEALAGSGDRRDEIVHEAADIIYHLFAALAFREVSFAEVLQELERREGVSGLEEKRRRG